MCVFFFGQSHSRRPRSLISLALSAISNETTRWNCPLSFAAAISSGLHNRKSSLPFFAYASIISPSSSKILFIRAMFYA
jgi:hypothetical protein